MRPNSVKSYFCLKLENFEQIVGPEPIQTLHKYVFGKILIIIIGLTYPNDNCSLSSFALLQELQPQVV